MSINMKELVIRVMCVLLGVVIGVSAIFGGLAFKENKHKLNSYTNSQIKEFEDIDFWNKVAYHYETDMEIFLDSYEDVYNSYSLYSYMDENLKSYFTAYGYDAVLCNGLESENKAANIYCIEKFCEIAGKEKINNKRVLKALENVEIDEHINTDSENETEYIKRARKRLEIAKAICSGSYDAEGICKSENSKRFVWTSNLLSTDNHPRMMEDGLVYEIECDVNTEENYKFLGDNVLEFDSYSSYDDERAVVYISKKINCYQLKELLDEYRREKEETEYVAPVSEILNMIYNENTLNATMTANYYGDDETTKYDFTLDLETGEITDFEEK